MEANDVELGPIDIVVIGYPVDAPMTGEAARCSWISSTAASSACSLMSCSS